MDGEKQAKQTEGVSEGGREGGCEQMEVARGKVWTTVTVRTGIRQIGGNISPSTTEREGEKEREREKERRKGPSVCIVFRPSIHCPLPMPCQLPTDHHTRQAGRHPTNGVAFCPQSAHYTALCDGY